jgi:hypothetical protein
MTALAPLILADNNLYEVFNLLTYKTNEDIARLIIYKYCGMRTKTASMIKMLKFSTAFFRDRDEDEANLEYPYDKTLLHQFLQVYSTTTYFKEPTYNNKTQLTPRLKFWVGVNYKTYSVENKTESRMIDIMDRCANYYRCGNRYNSDRPCVFDGCKSKECLDSRICHECYRFELHYSTKYKVNEMFLSEYYPNRIASYYEFNKMLPKDRYKIPRASKCPNTKYCKGCDCILSLKQNRDMWDFYQDEGVALLYCMLCLS